MDTETIVEKSKVKLAAREGDIDKLYTVIQENPHVLEDIDSVPFVDTPLHVAASVGHLQFASEVMRLKPSFAWKLNPQGFTPIHLALQHGHDRMVLHFVSISKDLVRAKGRKGRTPLHLASKKGEIELLIRFLQACPNSIEDVTVRSETALHIAVRCGQHETLQVLLGWLMRTSYKDAKQLEKTMLNWKDVEGNTILHLYSRQNNLQMVQLLLKTKLMDLKAKNYEEESALGITTNEEIRSVLAKGGANCTVITNVATDADTLKSKIPLEKRVLTYINRVANEITEEQRNNYLIIATLVITSTYEFGLNPPGGVYQANAGEGKQVGTAVLSGWRFIVLSVFNELSFFLSTMIIFILISTRRVGPMLSSLFILLTVTFYTSVAIIFPTVAIVAIGTPLVSAMLLLVATSYAGRSLSVTTHK